MWSKAASILALASMAVAQSKGFNYGSTNADGRCRGPHDFVRFFNEAKSLPGAPGFTTARLYTSIQCGTSDYPISAFQAAIDTDTHLLVGLWASAGRTVIENELNALLRAARELGTAFTDRVIGISVGSEDLYRSSPQGVANKAGAGATGAQIEEYIARVKDQIRGTALEKKPIGHVDTWTAWILPENRGVAKAVSWLGHNSFPYFETTRSNAIEDAQRNFYEAVGQTESVSDGKEVWITETGWPRFGPKLGSAVASLENSRRYWHEVGCTLFGTRNTFWYTLKDANVAQTDISFALTPHQNNTPFFDLTCK